MNKVNKFLHLCFCALVVVVASIVIGVCCDEPVAAIATTRELHDKLHEKFLTPDEFSDILLQVKDKDKTYVDKFKVSNLLKYDKISLGLCYGDELDLQASTCEVIGAERRFVNAYTYCRARLQEQVELCVKNVHKITSATLHEEELKYLNGFKLVINLAKMSNDLAPASAAKVYFAKHPHTSRTIYLNCRRKDRKIQQVSLVERLSRRYNTERLAPEAQALSDYYQLCLTLDQWYRLGQS